MRPFGAAPERERKNKAKELFTINTKEIESFGKSEGDITSYNFNLTFEDDTTATVSISEKGGHVIYMDRNREVLSEVLSEEEADGKAKEYLEKQGFKNMKGTYYLKQSGIVTINYAYVQDNVIMYPDLIKVKVALDNGEILGITLRTKINCKPVFVSVGNYISLEDSKKVIMNCVNNESRIPIPTRLADIETHKIRRKLLDNK